MKDPCFGLHREAISSLGLRVAPVPVDDAGLDVARLADLNVGAERVAYAGCVSKTLTPALGLDWIALPRWLIGRHAYVELPPWCDESALIGAARARGLLMDGATFSWSESSSPPALVLGYRAINETTVRNGLAVLGSIYEGLR